MPSNQTKLTRKALTATIPLLFGGLALFGCGDSDSPATTQDDTVTTPAAETGQTTTTRPGDEAKDGTGDTSVHPPKSDDEDKS